MVMDSNMKRIDWIDIFKALCIILMVVGHSTGLFNAYIYQFHMAAFFFISGVTSHLDKKSFLKITLNKIFTILLPLFTMIFIGLGAIMLLDSLNLYDMLFNLPYQGSNTLPIFLKTGDLYIQFYGATWFLPVLFGVFLLHKLFVTISNNKINVIYVLLSVMTYIVGMNIIKSGQSPRYYFFHLDLIMVGQIFFLMGVLFTQFKEKINLDIKLINIIKAKIWLKELLLGLLLLINLVIMYCFARFLHVTMDFPSRTFTNYFHILLSALNGISALYLVSHFITLLPTYLRSWISFIGKNTLGILFLHFVVFKVFLYILHINNVITLEELGFVVPSNEIGNKYWILLVITSISISSGIWFLLTHFRYVGFIFGGDKKSYDFIYNKLANSKVGIWLNTKKQILINLYSKIY